MINKPLISKVLSFWVIVLSVVLQSCYMDPPAVTIGHIKNESARKLIVRLDDNDSFPDNAFFAGSVFYVQPDSSNSLYIHSIISKPKHHIWHFDLYDGYTIYDFFDNQKNGVKFRSVINKSFLKRFIITQEEIEKKEIMLVYRDSMFMKKK